MSICRSPLVLDFRLVECNAQQDKKLLKVCLLVKFVVAKTQEKSKCQTFRGSEKKEMVRQRELKLMRLISNFSQLID